MAFTAKQIRNITKTDQPSNEIGLGTLLDNLADNLNNNYIVRGSYTAVAADATAESVVIDSTLEAISGWIAEVYRAGVKVTGDAVFTVDNTVKLKVANGASTYTVTAGDVINYIIW